MNKSPVCFVSIDQYIACLENCSLRHVESLAMIGLASSVNIENCDVKGFQRILLQLVNGKIVTSACFYTEEVEQSLKIIKTYIEFARKNEALGKLTIVRIEEE